MPKTKADITIGHRMAEELSALFPGRTVRFIAQQLGCSRSSVYSWQAGDTPSALPLARLHHLGGDVLYVLTGTRHARITTIYTRTDKGYQKLVWTGRAFEEE